MEALASKVSFIGLRCRGGFIRGVRGTIVGRELEDVKDRIENDFESWEIALIVSGSCGFAIMLALIGYGFAMYKMNYASNSEEYDMEGRVCKSFFALIILFYWVAHWCFEKVVRIHKKRHHDFSEITM